MNSNKKAKQKLIERYGSIDFLDALKIKVPECKRYTSKGQLKRMKQLTYHHILEKSKGGSATIENGALLTTEHHAWFHQQPPEIQRQLNQKFQEFKKQKDIEHEASVVFVNDDELSLPFELSIAELQIDSQGRVKTYNRSQQKRETQQMVNEYMKGQRDYEK